MCALRQRFGVDGDARHLESFGHFAASFEQLAGTHTHLDVIELQRHAVVERPVLVECVVKIRTAIAADSVSAMSEGVGRASFDIGAPSGPYGLLECHGVDHEAVTREELE